MGSRWLGRWWVLQVVGAQKASHVAGLTIVVFGTSQSWADVLDGCGHAALLTPHRRPLFFDLEHWRFANGGGGDPPSAALAAAPHMVGVLMFRAGALRAGLAKFGVAVQANPGLIGFQPETGYVEVRIGVLPPLVAAGDAQRGSGHEVVVRAMGSACRTGGYCRWHPDTGGLRIAGVDGGSRAQMMPMGWRFGIRILLA